MTKHVPPMTSQDLISRWLASFPELGGARGRGIAATCSAALQFNRLRGGDIAYRQGQTCHNYVMCIEGQTRVFKTSESGREILLYQVGPGETCVLTTSCLMAGKPLPGREHGRDRRAACRAAGQRVPPADGRLAAFPQIRARQLRGPAVEPDHARRRGGVRQPRSAARPPASGRGRRRRAWWRRPTSSLRSISAACAR